MALDLVATAVGLTIRILSVIGLPGLFALMVVESFGVPPLPSEVILPFAGFLAAEGTYSFGAALLAAVAGSVVGATLAYAVGRWGRARITGVGLGVLRIEESHLARMDAYFARWGELTVGVARMVPLARAYISYPAGTARMSPVRFVAFTALGTVPFALAMLYAGFVLRAHWDVITSYFAPLDDLFLVALVVGAVYVALLVLGFLAPGWPPRRRHPAPAALPPGAS